MRNRVSELTLNCADIVDIAVITAFKAILGNLAGFFDKFLRFLNINEAS